MTLYREGTLLRDSIGDLWMVLGYCKNPFFPTKTPNAYDIVRLENGFRYHFQSGKGRRRPVFRLAHSDFEVVSEV